MPLLGLGRRPCRKQSYDATEVCQMRMSPAVLLEGVARYAALVGTDRTLGRMTVVGREWGCSVAWDAVRCDSAPDTPPTNPDVTGSCFSACAEKHGSLLSLLMRTWSSALDGAHASCGQTRGRPGSNVAEGFISSGWKRFCSLTN